MSNRLSVVMIAKNAADLLPDCLGSVSWADEIIVLDSGSTDNTVELARGLGAQAIQRFMDQIIVIAVTGAFVQAQDAIGIPTAVAHKASEKIVTAGDTVDGAALGGVQYLKNSLPEFWRDALIGIDHQHPVAGGVILRALALNAIASPVGMGIDLGAEVIPLTGDLLHLTCRDFAGFQQKQLAYAAAWALERHQKGKKTSMAGIFSHTLGAFLKTLLLRGGVLDGKQGWLLAMVNAQYTFTKYTELWALSHGYSEKESS